MGMLTHHDGLEYLKFFRFVDHHVHQTEFRPQKGNLQ